MQQFLLIIRIRMEKRFFFGKDRIFYENKKPIVVDGPFEDYV